MPAHLIQGYFFQNHQWLGVAMGENGEGAIGVVKSGLCKFMFAGVIYPDEFSTLGELIGEMNDYFGESVLFKVSLTPEKLGFTKKYTKTDASVDYRFKRLNGIWIGSYSGKVAGSGSAKCVLTEVPEEFFQPSDPWPSQK